jgi:hypothetical protein
MSEFAEDIYTEPAKIDADTLKNLGPLRAMAGTWRGLRGLDVNPAVDGPRKQIFVETMSLEPLDPQTNGPQLLYGLRYHSNMVKPDEVQTYHDQVGYWLWEPATGTVVHTLTIPRGQVLMASGKAGAEDTEFELLATHESEHFGIRSSPFLDHAFKTVKFRIKVSVHPDGTWSYDETTFLKILGQSELFEHTDKNTLTRTAPPTPNPMVRKAS